MKWITGVRFLARRGSSSFHHCVQTSSGDYPASHLMAMGISGRL